MMMLRTLTPPPKLTVSQWADRHRRLSPEASAEPGQWNTKRANYQREPMDAISDPTVEQVVLKWSSQVGKTEILNNGVGYYIASDPSAMLYVTPNEVAAEAWSNDRLRPMLRDSPALAAKVKPARSWDSGNRVLHKVFPGGHVTIVGANAAAGLAMRPIRVLFCDEVDRYPASAGKEGDPLALAIKRTSTFWNRKIILCSSPTTLGRSRIDKAFEGSDQRRYFVPCPHCSTMQTLTFSQVKWTDNDWRTAKLHCKACDKPWSEAERRFAVSVGSWRASKPFQGIAGYTISELYSPWRRIVETTRDFLEAKDDPELLRVFLNTALAELWEDKGDVPDWERLVERREPLDAGIIPSEALVLTAGIDNQADRLELYVWAWGPGFTSWLVAREIVWGNPSQSETWDEMADLLATNWPCADGGTMRIHQVGVDVAGLYTAAIYGQLRRLRDPRILGMRGVEGFNRSQPVSGPTFVDVSWNGQKLRRGLAIWNVSVSTYKSDFYRRLWLSRGDGVGYPAGWVHIPEWCDGEAVKQMVAEELVTTKDRAGQTKREWRKTRERNEGLDCAVYARAALYILGADRHGEGFWTLFRRRPNPDGSETEPPGGPFTPPRPHPPQTPPAGPQRRVGRSAYMARIGR
jgi:phage terminase large subunit GpA-like protein